MPHIILNDYYLQAFVDAEITDDEATSVWHLILDNPIYRCKHELLIEQNKLLGFWWNSLVPSEQMRLS